jgi:hypothetical protein
MFNDLLKEALKRAGKACAQQCVNNDVIASAGSRNRLPGINTETFNKAQSCWLVM